ncbi:adenosylcobinamide amidohydrolase [Indiicoccus explosivorum]|uniref:adenosylcobinamide amidohydrolase n=1 Tax=Indiicoccus explosivorum TaxID=1917864 RepID=UPI000B44AAC0|nr:adenosylcobinamide amidohydrolase [Indiicoccus explosivorum]
MLNVTELTGGYGSREVIRGVSFQVNKGEMLGILGPNGSGKSTLLKLISGILPPSSGAVVLDGKNVADYTPRSLARQLAVLPQLHAHAFSHTVREMVALGRYPHQRGLFSSWSAEDEAAVRNAMHLLDVEKYEETLLEHLSGGEQQRAFVAQALAQDAPVMLLDEPTNHLDINHQKELLDTVKKQAIDREMTIVSIFHDINLASMYCDRLLLLDQGRLVRFGQPHEVVQEDVIREVYGTRVRSHPHSELPKPQITLLPEVKREEPEFRIRPGDLAVSAEGVAFQSRKPMKTVSSAVINAGAGWFRTFLNRRIPADYNCPDSEEEMKEYVIQEGFRPTETVGMMTAVRTEGAVVREYTFAAGTLVIMVTAGIGTATDVSRASVREIPAGTINTWVLINGTLSEEAFIQAMITATEAKAKALAEEDVRDQLTGTVATGTPTDSLLIAATQQGTEIRYAGPVTEAGSTIGKGVFECTVEAIRRYRAHRQDSDE